MILERQQKLTLIQAAEECFFEKHFDYGSTEEIVQRNYEKGMGLFHVKTHRCQELVKKVSDGEVVDPVALNLAVQELIFSYRHFTSFESAVGVK